MKNAVIPREALPQALRREISQAKPTAMQPAFFMSSLYPREPSVISREVERSGTTRNPLGETLAPERFLTANPPANNRVRNDSEANDNQ